MYRKIKLFCLKGKYWFIKSTAKSLRFLEEGGGEIVSYINISPKYFTENKRWRVIRGKPFSFNIFP